MYLQLAGSHQAAGTILTCCCPRPCLLSPPGHDWKVEQKEMQGTLRSTSLHGHDLQMQASAFRESYLMKPGQELPCTDGDQCHGNTLIARVSLQRVSRVGEVRGCICTSHFTFCKRKQATSSLVPHDPTPARSPSREAKMAHVLKRCQDTYYVQHRDGKYVTPN
jgi:hypothetical protein